MAVPLFTPFKLRGVTFPNRIGMPPMVIFACEKEDGMVTDTHIAHYGTRAMAGIGCMVVEATSIVKDGRISRRDLGIWDDEHVAGLKRLTDIMKKYGAVPGVQLAHAGRKGSYYVNWVKRGAAVPVEDGGWIPVSSGEEPFSPQSAKPRALDKDGIAEIVKAFGQAAARAVEAGFQFIEIHSAHGYLLNQFLSQLVNKRTDDYGGSLENRARFLKEVIQEVRTKIPDTMPLFVRISASDWAEGGWDIENSVELAKLIKPLGVDLIHCSSGGVVSNAKYHAFNGYQIPFAERIRKEAGIPTAAVGMITDPKDANMVIEKEQADLVMLGREHLRNPMWAKRAAHELGAPIVYPPFYHWAIGPR